MKSVSGQCSANHAPAALLLALALLVCHGFFGADHLTAGGEGPSAPGGPVVNAHAGHAVADHPVETAEGGEAPAVHGGAAADYFAVLLALAGAAFWLLRRCLYAPVWGSISKPVEPRWPSIVARLPCGPSPPLLQVFRL